MTDAQRSPASHPVRRIVGLLVVVLLCVVAIPYVLTLLYIAVNPVSTLMLWRWATGARVERTWVPIDAMSGALPLAVVVAEDGAVLPPSRRRPQGAARGDRGGRRCYRGARRLDHHPAGREEPVPVVGPQPRPQGARSPARAVDRSRDVEAPHHGDLSQRRRMGPGRRSSAPKPARNGRSARACASSTREKPPRWPRSCPTRSGAAPARRAPACVVSPASMWPARPNRHASPPACVAAPPHDPLALAFGNPILYKPGFPIRAAPPAPLWAVGAGARGFKENDAMAVPRRKTSPSRRGMRRSHDALKRPDLCGGQGFRRAAPPAPSRSQDRHVQGSADPQAEIGDVRRTRLPQRHWEGVSRVPGRDSPADHSVRDLQHDRVPHADSVGTRWSSRCP